MNIFVTSTDPSTCAKEHCDVHLRKMIVETAQLLATAHHELDGKVVAYKPTHKNHPCAVWVRQHPANFAWAVQLLQELCFEYWWRNDGKKDHKTEQYIEELSIMPQAMRSGIYTAVCFPLDFPKAMPDEFKQKCVETSYQDYLNAKFAEWRSRERPMKVEWTNRPKPVWVSL